MLLDRISQVIPVNIRYQIRELFELSRKRSMRVFHSQFIGPHDLVFDIGANIGDYATIFSDLGAKVICVEPQPFCIQKLRQRFRNTNKIKIVEKGVAEKSGKLFLHTDPRNCATATFSHKYIAQGPFNNRRWEKKTYVPVTTLDELIKQYGKPKYLKIDVEGYELNVLRGLHTTIPFISFEYTKQLLDDTEECLKYLDKLGEMRLNFSVSLNTTNLKLKKWTKSRDELIDNIKNSFGYSGDIFVMFTSK